MNTKVSEYVIRQLAATGFAVIDHVIARELTHDLIWASANNNYGDFAQSQQKIEKFLRTLPRVEILEIQFVGAESWVMVATRSSDMLSERIKHVVGIDVAAVRPFTGRRAVEAKEQRAAATDEPPSHACAARAEYFAERNLRDPKFDPATTFPPKRQGL
jgi:hypothetical protein